jgi:hypothetical protein
MESLVFGVRAAPLSMLRDEQNHTGFLKTTLEALRLGSTSTGSQ